MTEAEWNSATNSSYYLMRARQFVSRAAPTSAPSRKMRLYAVACCRGALAFLAPVFRDLLVEVEQQADQFDGRITASPTRTRANDELQRVLQMPDSDHRFYVAKSSESALLTSDPDVSAEDLMGNNVLLAVAMAGTHLLGKGGTEPVVLLRDIFGNPFRPVTFSPSWRTSTAVALASQIYESRDFSAMPILADALQDAGCDNTDILDHCRGEGPHVRGCWVVDLALGKM